MGNDLLIQIHVVVVVYTRTVSYNVNIDELETW